MEKLAGSPEAVRTVVAAGGSGGLRTNPEPSAKLDPAQVGSPVPRSRTMELRILLLPTAMFVFHACVFGGWLVDDAGISLAYARNLAAGYGLVSQPGMPPVEGYSNPLWVFLLSCGVSLSRFSPVVLSKLLSIAVIVTTFVICLRMLSDRLPNGRIVALLGLSLVSVQTSIVVWSISGLENSLTLLLTTALIATLVSKGLTAARIASLAGCLIAALALTRPEGILYGWLYPAALLRSSFDRKIRRAFAIYLGVILATAFPYFLVRLIYFNEILPNSYYAKGGPGRDTVMALVFAQVTMRNRAMEVLSDLTGRPVARWFLLAVLGTTLWALPRKTWTWTQSVLGLMTLTSLVGYLLLPSDWMPAHRYATAFFFDATLFTAALLFGGTFSKISEASLPRKSVLGVALVLALALVNLPRTLDFRRNPTISIQEVAARAHRLEVVADILQVKTASWLTPDVGGALLYSRMRIFDLGMLCDSRIARYLGEGVPKRNVEAFHNYVFEELQPTFISMRAYHSWISEMLEDPRFRRDYLPLREFTDDWIRERFGKTVISGEYIRRSAFHTRGPSPEAIRREWAAHPSPWDR